VDPVDGEGVVVAVCDRLGDHDIDPEAVRERVEADGGTAVVVRDLCSLRELPGGVQRTVLGVCPNGPSRADVQTAARRSRLDPFAVESVDLARASALGNPARRVERAAASLTARAAGLTELRPSKPDSLRMRLPEGRVSRRSLLSLGAVTYQPVAAIDPATCVGTERCGLCVALCRFAAIAPTRPQPTVAKDACTACAACVSGCPVDAIALPGADLARFEAELAVLCRDLLAGLLVSCGGWSPNVSPGDTVELLSLAVPCLSIVTPGWILQALAGGAPAVLLAGCGDACTAGSTERIRRHVAYCREVLTVLGVEEASSRVRLHVQGAEDTADLFSIPLSDPLTTDRERVRLVEPWATADGLLRIAGDTGATRTVSGGPLGVVSVETDGCTLCGSCVAACPTTAVGLETGPVVTTLTFDPSRCVACGNCAEICPEHVIMVERGTDLETLRAGRRTLKAGPIMRCRMCGRTIAPAAMIERIRALLPNESDELLATMTELCNNCRALTPEQ